MAFCHRDRNLLFFGDMAVPPLSSLAGAPSRPASRSLSCSRVPVPGERDPAVVYALAPALVMVLMALAGREGLVVAAIHVSCWDMAVTLPVGARPSRVGVACPSSGCRSRPRRHRRRRTRPLASVGVPDPGRRGPLGVGY